MKMSRLQSKLVGDPRHFLLPSYPAMLTNLLNSCANKTTAETYRSWLRIDSSKIPEVHDPHNLTNKLSSRFAPGPQIVRIRQGVWGRCHSGRSLGLRAGERRRFSPGLQCLGHGLRAIWCRKIVHHGNGYGAGSQGTDGYEPQLLRAQDMESNIAPGVVPRAASALFEKLAPPSSPSITRNGSGIRAPNRFSMSSTSTTGTKQEKTWQMKATYVEVRRKTQESNLPC